MSSTSRYFLSRDLTKKFFQSYFDRLDSTYTGFTRSTGCSDRLFDSSEVKKLSNKHVIISIR